jgi:hypothetical protein
VNNPGKITNGLKGVTLLPPTVAGWKQAQVPTDKKMSKNFFS